MTKQEQLKQALTHLIEAQSLLLPLLAEAGGRTLDPSNPVDSFYFFIRQSLRGIESVQVRIEAAQIALEKETQP